MITYIKGKYNMMLFQDIEKAEIFIQQEVFIKG